MGPVANGLVNILWNTLSPAERSRVTTERLLSDYDKVGVIIDNIKSREEFHNFCNVLECKLNHSRLANILRSEVAE